VTNEKLPKAKTVDFSVRLPPSADAPPAVYANYVSVSHTEFEVLLDFAQMALPTTEEELTALGDAPVLVAKPVARIAIPPVLLPRVVAALGLRMKVMEQEAITKAKDKE
jgi:hypothetical protein